MCFFFFFFFFFFDSRLWERGYTSLSSFTRLAVSLKLSSVGEKVLGRSLFWGLAGGTNGDGSGAEESPLLPAGFSSFICKNNAERKQAGRTLSVWELTSKTPSLPLNMKGFQMWCLALIFAWTGSTLTPANKHKQWGGITLTMWFFCGRTARGGLTCTGLALTDVVFTTPALWSPRNAGFTKLFSSCSPLTLTVTW